ncbi:MAG: T9SS type A sorting domain-containing protein [Flavobacteriales bacterium]|nr:T9SS type A sorting domain-containing protein [Flavobacteriales bacterium]
MRTRLLPTLLFPALLTAQPHYLDNDPVWTVTAVCNQAGMGGGPCITTDTYRYTLGADSIVDGITYKQVLRSGHVSYAWYGGAPAPSSCMGTSSYPEQFHGLLRQEGRALFTYDGQADALLFDFDLEVGDHLPITVNNWNDQVVVTALDSTQMDGEWRRIFTVEGDWSQVLVEGAGSDKGLFEPVSSAFECGYTLDCYGFGGQRYYPEPGPDCAGIMAVQDREDDGAALDIMPNPASSQVTIRVPQSVGPATVEVLDMHGRSRLSAVAANGAAVVDVAALADGAYVVRSRGARHLLVVQR